MLARVTVNGIFIQVGDIWQGKYATTNPEFYITRIYPDENGRNDDFRVDIWWFGRKRLGTGWASAIANHWRLFSRLEGV